MNSLWIFLAAACGFALGSLLFIFLQRRKNPSPEIAKVKTILDGDTVILARGWREFTVRLDSIDCPESDQPWGGIAKAGLIKLIGGKAVKIERHTIDAYQRTVATLHVYDDRKDAWVNVNARLVTLGHAWVYRRFYDHLPYERRRELENLERWARRKRVGLWKYDDPIPPWRWRQQKSISRPSGTRPEPLRKIQNRAF